MFPEDALFDYVLIDLAEELAAYTAPAMRPLPCDRWIARSALQKACRRGEVEIAQRALATLLTEDRYSIWRHLIVIAIEDIGVPGIDVIARVVAASRSRPWRTRMGGEWAVASLLVQQMCESVHCQAVCDLLLRATNDPALEQVRADALEADLPSLAAILSDSEVSLLTRGVAALAMGGGLREGQQHKDTCAVFDVLAEAGSYSHVVATARQAYRTSRNEMALLLPLIWEQWMLADGYEVADDTMPPTVMIGEVPGYAIDQFTRVGGQVARAFLAQDPEMAMLMNRAAIPPARRPSVIGDVIFMIEGSCVGRRAIWLCGDGLRLPKRVLSGAIALGEHLPRATAHMAVKGTAIAGLRIRYLTLSKGGTPSSTPQQRS